MCLGGPGHDFLVPVHRWRNARLTSRGVSPPIIVLEYPSGNVCRHCRISLKLFVSRQCQDPMEYTHPTLTNRKWRQLFPPKRSASAVTFRRLSWGTWTACSRTSSTWAARSALCWPACWVWRRSRSGTGFKTAGTSFATVRLLHDLKESFQSRRPRNSDRGYLTGLSSVVGQKWGGGPLVSTSTVLLSNMFDQSYRLTNLIMALTRSYWPGLNRTSSTLNCYGLLCACSSVSRWERKAGHHSPLQYKSAFYFLYFVDI